MRPHGVLLLAARSLRQRMRDPWQAVLRGLLCLGLLYAVWGAWEYRNRFGAAGLVLFQGLLLVDLVAVPVLAITVTSASLVEERENQTLALLRLTGLGPWSILLGKSLADLVTVLLVLGLQIPFAFLLIALGGVSPTQAIGAFTMLCCYVVFVWGIATAASASAWNRVQAAWRTGIIVGAIVGGPLLLCAFESAITRGGPRLASMRWARAAAFLGINDVMRARSGTPLVPIAALIHLAIGLGAVLLAARWLARERPAGATSLAPRDRAPVRPPVHARRPGVCERALAWKETRHGATRVRWAFYVLVALAGMLPLFLRASSTTDWGPMPLDALLATRALEFLEPVLLVDVVLLASRVFADEIHDRTLAALATLPLGTRAWFNAKVIGIARLVTPGLILIGIAAGVLMAEANHLRGGNPFLQLLAGAADLAVALHLAVWFSLRHERGAAFGSVAIVAAADQVVRWVAGSLGGDPGDNLRVALWLMELVACLPLHAGIMRRLREHAAR